MFIEAKSRRKSAFESHVLKEAKKEKNALLLCTQPWSFFTVFGPNSSTTFLLNAVISLADASLLVKKASEIFWVVVAQKPTIFHYTSVMTLPAWGGSLPLSPRWKLRCFPFEQVWRPCLHAYGDLPLNPSENWDIFFSVLNKIKQFYPF